MNSDYTIIIVDDDPAVCDSLTLLLETYGYNVVVFFDGESFLKSGLSHHKGCALLDVRMPGRSGLEILPDARRQNTALPIIIMSGHADIAMAVQALKNGAFDFIEKPFQAKEVLAVIDQSIRSASQISALSQAQNAAQNQLAKLTPREQEIALSLSRGQTNKSIAFELGISVRTVETHRAHVMSKLDIKSVSELVRLVISAQG
jgi:FixJ family two-component response regulator